MLETLEVKKFNRKVERAALSGLFVGELGTDIIRNLITNVPVSEPLFFASLAVGGCTIVGIVYNEAKLMIINSKIEELSTKPETAITEQKLQKGRPGMATTKVYYDNEE